MVLNIRNKNHVHWCLAYVIPVAFFILTLVIEHAFGYGCFTGCEDGPVENAQAIVLFIAFGLGVGLLARKDAYSGWIRAWFAVGTLAALYIALEEISYGQRIFGWVTPEAWDLVNDQQETNLHNTSHWLDQKPRAILEIGVYVGGLIIPALRRWKPEWLPQKFAPIYPSGALFLTAIFALALRLSDSGLEAIGRQDLFFVNRMSEMQESYFGWFILLYIIDMRRRFRPASV